MPDNTTEAAQSTNNAATEKSQADVLFGEAAKTETTAVTAEQTQEATQTEAKAAEQTTETEKKADATETEAKAEVKVGELKVPKDSPLDQSRVEKIAEYAKAKGLSNEQAQILVDVAHEQLAGYQESILQNLQDQKVEWANKSMADKEFGGADFAKNVEVAHRGMLKTASPELQKMLDDSGLGNHPEVLRHFFKLGKESENGSFHQSGAASNSNKKSAADILFG